MTTWLRRIRGTAGMGLIWTSIAVPIGFVFYVALFAMHGEIFDFTDVEVVVNLAFTWGLIGVCSGLIFSGALALSERGLDSGRVSMVRVALDGAVAGALGYVGGFFALVGPAFNGPLWPWLAASTPQILVSSMIGALTAIGLVKIARSELESGPASAGQIARPNEVGAHPFGSAHGRSERSRVRL